MTERLAVRSTDIRLCNIEARLPFEFGIATMTELPHCIVGLQVAVDGEETRGLAADHLFPQWFRKDPDRSPAAEAAALLEVVEQACEHAEDTGAATVFEYFQTVHAAQREWARTSDDPPLMWNFGVTFVERALIDAVCRARELTFAEAVRENALGFDPGRIYPELEGEHPADSLPDEPERSIAVRHTVGHADPLRAADGRPDDGLPVTLAENIRAYGLDRFKLKVGGDPAADADRLRDIFDVLESAADDYAFTLDANEQYESVDALRALLERLRADPEVPALGDRLLFVEQPFPREIALSDRIGDDLAGWADRPPIIIDESDAELDSFGRALDLGYDGTSQKNCKGVFKGLANAMLAERRRERGDQVVLSAEDLTTIGPVSLLQDLAVVATLGIPHVERNGHHYFRGLDMFEDDVGEAVRAAHGDLYRALPDGTTTLDVRDGRVTIDSVLDAPFGYACDLDLTQYETPEEWSF